MAAETSVRKPLGSSRSLTVVPGSPALPSSIDVVCQGLRPAGSLELLIGRIPVSVIVIEADGSVDYTYSIVADDERGKIEDLSSCQEIGEVDAGRGVLCGMLSGEGNDMSLRYSSVT